MSTAREKFRRIRESAKKTFSRQPCNCRVNDQSVGQNWREKLKNVIDRRRACTCKAEVYDDIEPKLEEYGVVHQSKYTTHVWIGYSAKRRKFVKKLEKFIDKELHGQVECLFQECKTHLTEPEYSFMENSLKLATKYVILFDENFMDDKGFRLKLDSAIHSYILKEHKCHIIFVKMEKNVDFSNVTTDNVDFVEIDFSDVEDDIQDLSQNKETKSLIRELLDLDIDVSGIEPVDPIFVGANVTEKNCFNKEADYIYTHPGVILLDTFPKAKSIAAGVHVQFYGTEPCQPNDSFIIQKCFLTDQMRDLIINDDKNTPFREIHQNVVIGTYVSINPYPVSNLEIPFMARILVSDPNLKNCFQKHIRILFSSSCSPVGAKWSDVTNDSSLSCGYPRMTSCDDVIMRRGVCDGYFQFEAFKCGTYLICCSLTPDDVEVHCSVANSISRYINDNFARLIVHFDDNPDSPSDERKLIIRCEVARLDTSAEHYGTSFQDIVVRINGDKSCHTVMKYSCEACGNRLSFPHSFDLSGESGRAVFPIEMKYGKDWRFKVKFYSDDNYTDMIAKIATGSDPKRRRNWPPLYRYYHRCWSAPVPEVDTDLTEFDTLEELGRPGLANYSSGSHRAKIRPSGEEMVNYGRWNYGQSQSCVERYGQTNREWSEGDVRRWQSLALTSPSCGSTDNSEYLDEKNLRSSVKMSSNSRKNFNKFYSNA